MVMKNTKKLSCKIQNLLSNAIKYAKDKLCISLVLEKEDAQSMIDFYNLVVGEAEGIL